MEIDCGLLRAHWVKFLRPWSSMSIFPREFGLYRNLVFKEGYIQGLMNSFLHNDCYVAVYSEEQIRSNIYDTIFVEARDETETLSDVINDRDIIRGIFDKYEIAYRMFFSAGRSYHFLLDFPPTYIPNLSATVRDFIYTLDLVDMVDMHVIGNKRSMERVIYTKHKKSGRFAIYSETDDPNILEYESLNMIMTSELPTFQETKILDYLIPKEESSYELFTTMNQRVHDGLLPDCVLAIINKLYFEHHATHNERIHLVATLNQLGWSEDDIVSILSEASDFKAGITTYHVRDIMSKNFRPFSCSRVKRDMREVCPFAGSSRLCNYIKTQIEVRQ